MRSPDEIRDALTGPVPSIRMPFTRHGDVDYGALRGMIDFDIEVGSKTILLTAGDSHFLCLTDDEIAEVAKVTVEHTAGRAMVVAADRHFATPKAIEFARYVRDLGADVLMTLPPDWALSTTPETLAEHYAAVAEIMPVMLVTNIFIPHGQEFGLRTVRLTLEKSKAVVAIKDDFCGEFARKLALLVHEHWAVFSGGKMENHLNMLPYGCDGYLSTFMMYVPRVAHRYWGAIQDNNMDEAMAVIREIDMPFFGYIAKSTGGFDACMHGMLELYGLAGRWRRKPYYTLSDQEMAKLANFLRGLGVL